MALNSRITEKPFLNGKSTNGTIGMNDVATTGLLVSTNGAARPRDRRHRLEEWRQVIRNTNRYFAALFFFVGLMVGTLATRAPKKERDVYRELIPATEAAYKMKATLLKADLLFQGMDSVIENANKNLVSAEGE